MGVAVRDLTDLTERWFASSEVDHTATPAFTPLSRSAGGSSSGLGEQALDIGLEVPAMSAQGADPAQSAFLSPQADGLGIHPERLRDLLGG